MSNELSDQPLPDKNGIDIKTNAVKFGLIGGFAGILVSLSIFFANLQYESWSKWLQSLVMLAAIILGIKAIADANKVKLISFGDLFKGGMLITFILSLISILYFLVYSNIIEPDFIDNLMDVSKKEMLEKGLSEEQTETALNISRKFMSPGIMAVISLVSSLIIGAITSAIGAAIFKNEK